MSKTALAAPETTNSHKHNVFVYGTLRKGYYNHVVLKRNDAVFLSNDHVKGERVDLGSFPALTEGLGLVDGEIYAVNDAGLEDMDWLEGHPHFYERREVTTEGGMKVWTYFGTGCMVLAKSQA